MSDVQLEKEDSDVELRLYRRRWLMLGLYVLFCINNIAQWIQYSIIADVVIVYYNVEYAAVNWTSMVWMVVYIVFMLPATWLLNMKGLRFVFILGQAVTCAGSWIKVGSVSPDLFWLTFIGQSVVSLAQVYAMGTPSAMAAKWFGAKEVSTATAIGVSGFMLGTAFGSLIPPLIVQGETTDEIGNDLFTLFLSFAIFTTVLLVLLIIFLEDKPPTPPSTAQVNRNDNAEVGGESPRQFMITVGHLLRNFNFLTLLVSYGIAAGVFSAVMTFLNQIVLEKYPNGNEFVGYIGVTVIIFGLMGALVCGFLLDSTRKYKEICFGLYALSTLCLIGITLLVSNQVEVVFVYIVAAITGFALIGYLPAGYEFGAELTYPEAEATTACVLAISTQVFALIFTLVYGAVLPPYGGTIANWSMCAALVIGVLLAVLTKSDLRRQQAENKAI